MREREPEIGCQLSLVALIGVALVASGPYVVDGVAGVLTTISSANATRSVPACSACGVVERVREVNFVAPKHQVSTVAGGGPEGIAVFLAAVTDRWIVRPATVYEVAVRLHDGSTRILQFGAPPAWKPGDRVKVVMGRIEPAPFVLEAGVTADAGGTLSGRDAP